MSSPNPTASARLAVGSVLSPEVLAALDTLFPNTLPPYGTSVDEVARRQAHREVISALRACYEGCARTRLGGLSS